MALDLIQTYIGLNETLVRTLVIKMTRNVTSINDYLTFQYGSSAVTEVPTTWKWYLNITGQYHYYDSQYISTLFPGNSYIMITSIDTHQSIAFTREVLVNHPRTVKAYQYGTRYYNLILNQYPELEQLILGVLYPVLDPNFKTTKTTTLADIKLAGLKYAIAAKNGTILSYPSNLVEPQEMTLVSDLQNYIQRYIVRWDVEAFGVSDNLYNAAQFALMTLHTYTKLLNLRLKRCKTYEAHTFHVTQYLASHEALDNYIPYMTMKQKLWLYRNLLYIERNSGRIGVFNKLIEKLLSDRDIPISGLSVRQLTEFDSNYYPMLSTRMDPINVIYNGPVRQYYDVPLLLAKEGPLAPGNVEYIQKESARILHTLKTGYSSALQTKALESNMVDYSDDVPDSLPTVLLRQWAYLFTTNTYLAYIDVVDPVTTVTYSLSVNDAFIYMWYLQIQAIQPSGVKVIKLPPFYNQKYRCEILPSVSDMLKVVDDAFISNAFNISESASNGRDLDKIAALFISKQPVYTSQYLSTKSFFDMANVIYNQSQLHWYYITDSQDLYRTGLLRNMIYQLYRDEAISFTEIPSSSSNPTPADMSAWLKSKGLPEYNLSYDQAQHYIAQIFTAATGWTIDPITSLSGIQNAMMTIIKQLSSYSIQFISEINTNQVLPLAWDDIRVGNINFYAGQTYILHDFSVNVYPGLYDHPYTLDAGTGGVVNNLVYHSISVDTSIDFNNPSSLNSNLATASSYPFSLEVSGYDLSLTPEQLAQIHSYTTK